MSTGHPLVSIVVTTRNRSVELKRALRSCLAQDYHPMELLVYDDASSDDTASMVRTEFPSVRLIRSEKRVGLIVLRNRGFRDAGGEYVFSLDDDAYYVSKDTVARTVSDFAANENIAAVAIPFTEAGGADAGASQSAGMILKPHDSVCSYRGCAHAIRRTEALAVGSYRDFLVHQGEERDLCIRLLEAGRKVIYGSAPPMVHDYSPLRAPMRMRYYGIRNTLLFDVLNVPSYIFWRRYLKDCVSLCFYMRRNIPLRLVLVPAAAASSLRYIRQRKPVSRAVYETFRRLPGHSPLLSNDALPVPLT